MFGRGLLNLALGAELKSLPALKEEETFRVSTSQSGSGRFRCSVTVEIQKRARFPGRIPVVGGRNLPLLRYRYNRPSSFHTLPKLIWCDSWGCNLGQSLSNHGPHVSYRRKIRRASRPGKQFNLVIDEEPLDNACHVWSCIILMKYGCGQVLKVRKDNWLQHLGDVALAV
ncbi:uncharacterized protein TNCV_2935601 [Trichonephila clavipes]|nr:uncharacterized protein TNCV_2935601 [Trichonephila clavipes]